MEGSLEGVSGVKIEAKTVFNVAYEKVIRGEENLLLKNNVTMLSGGSIIFGPGDPLFFGLSVQVQSDVYYVNIMLGQN